MITAQEKLLVTLREFLASDISSAVWGYSTRTLLDFGNLVSNIWGIPNLQELVTAAGSLSTLFGVQGGAQTFVGGIIIIAVAGSVFLAVYMTAFKPAKPAKKGKTEQEPKRFTFPAFPTRFAFPRLAFPRIAFPLVVVLAGFLSATASALITGTALSLTTQARVPQSVLGDATEGVAIETEPVEEQLAVGGPDIVRVVVPAGSRLNLRSQPELNASVLTKIEDTREVVRLDESQDWTKVTLEDLKLEGWISTEFVEEGTPENGSVLGSEVGKTVLILDTPTGWARVRQTPWGEETGRVYTGDRLPYLAEVEGWVQIELSDANRGWVYKEYAQVE